MKFVRAILKPFVILYALVGLVFISLAKKMVVKLKIRSLYKNVPQLDAAKARLYRHLVNPYRISNGIGPCMKLHSTDPVADIQMCHEMISRNRFARSVS